MSYLIKLKKAITHTVWHRGCTVVTTLSLISFGVSLWVGLTQPWAAQSCIFAFIAVINFVLIVAALCLWAMRHYSL